MDYDHKEGLHKGWHCRKMVVVGKSDSGLDLLVDNGNSMNFENRVVRILLTAPRNFAYWDSWWIDTQLVARYDSLAQSY